MSKERAGVFGRPIWSVIRDRHSVPIGTQPATERETVRIFRSFTPLEIASVYGPFLADTAARTEELEEYSELADSLFRLAHMQRLYDRFPDIAGLHSLLDIVNPRRLVVALPDKFGRLVGDTGVAIKETDIDGLIKRGSHDALLLGIKCAFTPLDERPAIIEENFTYNLTQFNPQQLRQIVTFTPDLTSLATPEDRLSGAVQMLTLTYEDSLDQVLERKGLSRTLLSERGARDSLTRQVHQEAGTNYARQSLFGILTDRAKVGNGSAFKVYPPDNPMTEREQCPAKEFVDVYFQGVGCALNEQRKSVLHVAKSFERKKLVAG